MPYGNVGLRDVARGLAPINKDMSGAPLVPHASMGNLSPDWNTGRNDHYELDTGGAGVFAALSQLTFAFWTDAMTSRTQGATIWSERPSGNPIWKVTGPGDSAIGVSNWGLVRRNTDASGLTRIANDTNVTTAGLHLWAMTIDGATLNYYRDGISDGGPHTYSTGSITADDPHIGWDDQGSTTSAAASPIHMIMGWNRVLSLGELRALWTPQFRWDIYDQGYRYTSIPAAAGGGGGFNAGFAAGSNVVIGGLAA